MSEPRISINVTGPFVAMPPGHVPLVAGSDPKQRAPFKSITTDFEALRKRLEELFPPLGGDASVAPQPALAPASDVYDNYDYACSPAVGALQDLRAWNALPPEQRAQAAADVINEALARLGRMPESSLYDCYD